MSCGTREPAELTCLTGDRRAATRREGFNGLDYIEVSDDQLSLTIYFIGPAPEGIGVENIEITGGARVRGIRVLDVRLCPQVDPELDNCLVVTVDRPGDFSTYTLCLVNLPDDARFDPRYLCLRFSFKAACSTDLDCKTEPFCPPVITPAPDIDYLAKDYASFRQLILDRLAVVMPDWKERHVPDIGITLVELFAYVGDYLSYYQDAVATEAYLDTARQRISVRRHVRLVDYRLHEGCNARAWVAVETSDDTVIGAGALAFLTDFEDAPDFVDRVPGWDEFRNVPETSFEVFEPVVGAPDAELHFFQAHNLLRFYTWGDSECCLPRGATSATLIDGAPQEPPEEPDDSCEDEPGTVPARTEQKAKYGHGPDQTAPKPPIDAPAPDGGRVLHLKPGDVLIFVEVIGPGTGAAADADPARRQAVRLTRVEPVVDPLNGQPLLEIAWAEEDALAFAFCLSAIGPPPDCKLIGDISVALGNVVLADHGRTRPAPQDLGCVPMESEDVFCLRAGRPSDPVRHPGKFDHAAIEGPLTFAAPIDLMGPAATALVQDPRQALPRIILASAPDPDCGPQPSGAAALDWTPELDLLASGRDDTHFVVEVDDRRRPHLRFGDDKLGRRPDANSRFLARYRRGNGPVGNVGADKLTLAVATAPVSGLTLRPRNPLPARGGTQPEPASEAKLFAPYAFNLTRERAVTPADYAEIAAQVPGVQRAAASLRWTGSWYKVRVAVDPLGRAVADAGLLDAVWRHLYRFRRIGHDLAVRPAAYVPLDIVLQVCVEPRFLRAHVEAALRQRFGAGCLPDGTPAYFTPDALSFGQDIALSRLVAAAQAIEGVQSVTVTVLERLFEGPNGEIEAGVLPIGPLEVARLDSDPNFPENGRIRFDMRGGR